MAKRSTRPPKRKRSWVEPFVKDVQVPGVYTTYSAANSVEKFLWALFLLVFIVLTGVHVVKVVIEFTKAPTVTKATAVLNKERRPPDMELCIPYDASQFIFGHLNDKCAPELHFNDILENVTSSINSTGDFAEAVASKNIFARKALLKWIALYNEIEFYEKYDRETMQREKVALDILRKQPRHENYTGSEKPFQWLLQPTNETRNWEDIYQRRNSPFYLALDAHLRSVGITFEHAWSLYSEELFKVFNPWYIVHLGSHKFANGVFPRQSMRIATTENKPAICLRLLLNAHVQAYNGKGLVRISVNQSTALPLCNSTKSRAPIRPPYITLQPYNHHLALGKQNKVTGVPGRRKVVHLGIRAEYESDPSEGCDKNASDIDLCRLECRYRYIRNRCTCRPPFLHRGTQTFTGVNEPFNFKVLPAQYLDKEMRECNVTDYFLGDCYSFNADGAEDDEDICRRSCKQNCMKYGTTLLLLFVPPKRPIRSFSNTQWEFNDEEVFDDTRRFSSLEDTYPPSYNSDIPPSYLDIRFSYFSYPLFKSERKLTWFNVLSDIGGALGLFLGLSIFSVIHTLMLPIHLFMKNRQVKMEQATALTDVSVLRQFHELRKATEAADPTETETTDKRQGE